MLLWAWFVDLKLREVVLGSWSLIYSINICILTRLATQISHRLGISQKLIYSTSCLWQKNPCFRKNSICSLVWPDFDSFESADWPLKCSTNFRIWWKIFSAYDLHKLPTKRHLRNAVFDANLNSRVPSGLFWHTRVVPRIAVQQDGDHGKKTLIYR